MTFMGKLSSIENRVDNLFIFQKEVVSTVLLFGVLD